MTQIPDVTGAEVGTTPPLARFAQEYVTEIVRMSSEECQEGDEKRHGSAPVWLKSPT